MHIHIIHSTVTVMKIDSSNKCITKKKYDLFFFHHLVIVLDFVKLCYYSMSILLLIINIFLIIHSGRNLYL